MDYMKGYRSRTSRRRTSYSRRRDSIKRRRRGSSISLFPLKISIAVVVFVLAAIGLFYYSSQEDGDGQSKLAATASAITGTENESVSGAAAEPEALQTAVPGGVAEAVKSVGALSSDAIVKPTPVVRSKAVALTFDDGPSTVNTPKILDILEKYNAHATFFVLGNRASAGAEVLKRELALNCEIANHSWDHESLSSMNMKGVNKEYDKTANLVKKLTGAEVTLLRPPYGAISDLMRQKLKHPMIFWSIDTLDWKSLNAKKVFRTVKKEVSDGDIILMHDIHAPTAEAVEKIVPWLLKNDYDLLTVSELMERKGIRMKNGTVYARASN